MERLNEIKTETYTLCGFIVDIVENSEDFEAYIQKTGYGVKSLVFGMPKNQQTYNDFLDLVEINLLNEPYFEDYENDYC